MAKEKPADAEKAVTTLEGVIRHSSLDEAMLGVMLDVDYVQKQKSPGLNYSFAGEAAIIGVLHQAMAKHGVTVTPTAVETVAREAYQTAKGGSMNRVILKMTYTFTHALSGDTRQAVSMGEAADSGDKATAKAMTIAFKYALRQSFMLETGDDPDTTPSAEVQRASAPTQAPMPNQGPTAIPQDVYDKGIKAIREAGHAPDIVRFVNYLRKFALTADQTKAIDSEAEARTKAINVPPPAGDDDDSNY